MIRKMLLSILLLVVTLSCAGSRKETTSILPAGEQLLLFDGSALDFWQPLSAEGALPALQNGVALLRADSPANGMVWFGPFPQTEYEVQVRVRFTEERTVFRLLFPIGEANAAAEFDGTEARIFNEAGALSAQGPCRIDAQAHLLELAVGKRLAIRLDGQLVCETAPTEFSPSEEFGTGLTLVASKGSAAVSSVQVIFL